MVRRFGEVCERFYLFFCGNLIWNFHNGNNILIGVDAIKGVEMVQSITPHLLSLLHQKALFYWAQVIEGWKDDIPQWKSNKVLALQGDMATQWKSIICNMKYAGFYKIKDRDSIEWQVKKGRSTVLVRDIYQSLIDQRVETSQKIFPYSLWKVCCPLKIVIFSWSLYHNRNLTWSNLQKRRWYGPAIWVICLANIEDNLHIFLSCPQSPNLWTRLATYYGFPNISHSSITEAFEWWVSQKVIWCRIPLIVFCTYGSGELKESSKTARSISGVFRKRLFHFMTPVSEPSPNKKINR